MKRLILGFGRFSFSANSCFTRKAAPHIEFVGPLEKVRMGTFATRCAWRMVPSFWVRKTGHLRLRREAMACWKEEMVRRAKGRMEAFRMAVFSRATKPRLATMRRSAQQVRTRN